MKSILTYLLILFFPMAASARIYIPVDQPSDKKFPIAITDLKGNSIGTEIADIMRNDLDLSGYFQLIPQSVFQKRAEEDGATIESISFSYWTAIEAQGLVTGSIDTDGGAFVITLRLFDPYAPEMLIGKQYRAEKKDIREVAHRFSDEILEALTGIRGVFTTKIAYTVATGKRKKEIHIMDMDGKNSRRLTSSKSLSISPEWSPDGHRLIFTSYMDGAPDLYIMGTDGKGLTRLTFGKGASLTPIWSPDGQFICFANTETGEADIYCMNTNGKRKKQLTAALGIDLSPEFSPDGSEIVFASERAGKLHLFKMPSMGGEATRLTFVGYHNDMPSWSPRADKIAFAGRDQGDFDIFIMNPDGSNIQRLTINSRGNEHPSFSPDGRFIVFSSTREGEPAIYLMRADGTNQRRISSGGGILPTWGPRTE